VFDKRYKLLVLCISNDVLAGSYTNDERLHEALPSGST
jgi:hypothetical protein